MRRPLAAAGALLAVLCTGCGLGTSERVQEVDPELLANLNEPTTSTTTTTSTSTSTTTPVPNSEPPDSVSGMDNPTTPSSPASVPATSTTMPAMTTTTVEIEPAPAYFIDGSQLVMTEMDIPVGASLRRRLRLLEEGPSAPLAADGTRTALPAGLVSGMEVGAVDVTVHLDGELFAAIDASDQRLMIGQIVLTLTEASGIELVNFTLDGEPLGVHRRDNTLGAPGEPVSRRDYDVLLADEVLRTSD